MDVAVVVERVRVIAAVRADAGAGRCDREAALTELRRVRAWVDASEADLAAGLAAEVSFPEDTLATTSKGSIGAAAKTLERSDTLGAVPSFAAALDDGAITSGHVDAVTRVAKGLEPDQRTELLERVGGLVNVAAHATQAEFGRRVRDEARRIQQSDGLDRLERQRRATSLRTWVDDDGMWNLRGRFDPLTGVRLAARLDATVETLFAEATPPTSPADPVERQHHLRALALARIVSPEQSADGGARGTTGHGRSGRVEYVVVVDADQPDGSGGACAEWPIHVEVPWRVLAELADTADVHAVVVRNGVVLHAPGELDLGRTTRLANRAQRRALRGLYRTCAIPGCSTHYDRCNLHHVIWWRHGGRTDLDNLVPLCTHHHHRVHDDGWQLGLGPNRELTLTLPDGTVRSTGPPGRRAA